MKFALSVCIAPAFVIFDMTCEYNVRTQSAFSDYLPREKYLFEEIANIISGINSITKPNTQGLNNINGIEFGTKVNLLINEGNIYTAPKAQSLIYATVLFYVATNSDHNISITLEYNCPLYKCERDAGFL